jgi:hypothetical protein
MALGSLADNPTMRRLKTTPMDSTVPAFWNVARMPEAWPRWGGGTAFMTAVVLGGMNIPIPTPFRKMSPAKAT